MSRIPISGIPQTYADTQAGDTFAMDRGGVMGKITYDDLSAAFIETIGVGTISFSTAAMGFGRVTTSTASRFDLQATSVADTHERTRLVRDTTAFRHQTGDNNAVTFVDDYVATVGASGVTSHQWNITGTNTFQVFAGGFLLSGIAPQARLNDTSGTASTHQIAYLQYNDSVLTENVMDSSGVYVETGRSTTFGASGATEHALRIASTQHFRVINGSVESVSHFPLADNTYTSGSVSRRWQSVWSVNGTLQTSDLREKEDVQFLTDAEERLALRLKGLIRSYRWKANPEKKHFGVIAQEVIEAFEAEGLGWTEYGIISGGGDEPYAVNYAELHSLILGV